MALSAEEKIINQVKSLIKAESKKVSPVTRRLTINVAAYVNPGSLAAVKTEIDKLITTERATGKYTLLEMSAAGLVTAAIKPTTMVKASEKSSADKVAKMIIGMVEKELAVTSKSERTLHLSIDWAKVDITDDKEKDKLITKLKKHDFSVNGKKQKLLKNAVKQSTCVEMTIVLPENQQQKAAKPKTKAAEASAPEAGAAPAGAPAGGMVTSSRPMAPAEMSPYVAGVGKALKFGGLILAATLCGPAAFLMAAGVMMASKYLDNQRAMAAPVSGS